MEYEFDELTHPIPEGRDWWEGIQKFPVKLIDQSFGYELQKSDMLNPDKMADSGPWPRNGKCLESSGHSHVTLLDDTFQVEVSTGSHFKDSDVDVKIEKGFLVVRGCHGDVQEGDGTTRRSFTRRYILPYDCDEFVLDQQKVVLSEGVVTVTLPRNEKKDKTAMDVDV